MSETFLSELKQGVHFAPSLTKATYLYSFDMTLSRLLIPHQNPCRSISGVHTGAQILDLLLHAQRRTCRPGPIETVDVLEFKSQFDKLEFDAQILRTGLLED